MRTGEAADGFSDVLRCATFVTCAEAAAVIAWGEREAEVLSAVNWPFGTARKWRATRAQSARLANFVIQKPLGQGVSPIASGPSAFHQGMVSIPLKVQSLGHPVTLTCVGSNNLLSAGPSLAVLHSLSDILLQMLLMYGSLLEARRPPALALIPTVQKNPDIPLVLPGGTLSPQDRESPEVVSRFLIGTLAERYRARTRDEITFHAIRAWRASLKSYQIEALRALKSAPPADFVDTIAQEIVREAKRLGGDGVFRQVAAVPCGNSGPGCLAERIAKAVAPLLGAGHVMPFRRLPKTGGSHPKANMRRAAIELEAPVDGPVLLVDDVATSGAHMAEAVSALRKTASFVLPIAWIG